MNLTKRAAARGLTLIELTVVLLILAATAGVLVPRLVGYSTRAHGATGSSNMGEVAKAISLFETDRGVYPDGWDSLTTATDALWAGTGGSTNLAATALVAGENDALIEAGIVNLAEMDDASADFTFAPYAGTTETLAPAGTPTLVKLAGGGAAALGLPGVDADYVVLGLGAQSSLIGDKMLDAPVHFPEGGDAPATLYSRFCGVFRVADAGTPLERATFATVATIHDGGTVIGLGEHLAEYFEAAAQ